MFKKIYPRTKRRSSQPEGHGPSSDSHDIATAPAAKRRRTSPVSTAPLGSAPLALPSVDPRVNALPSASTGALASSSGSQLNSTPAFTSLLLSLVGEPRRPCSNWCMLKQPFSAYCPTCAEFNEVEFRHFEPLDVECQGYKSGCEDCSALVEAARNQHTAATATVYHC